MKKLFAIGAVAFFTTGGLMACAEQRQEGEQAVEEGARSIEEGARDVGQRGEAVIREGGRDIEQGARDLRQRGEGAVQEEGAGAVETQETETYEVQGTESQGTESQGAGTMPTEGAMQGGGAGEAQSGVDQGNQMGP